MAKETSTPTNGMRPSAIIRLLAAAYSTQSPIMLWGPPGIGKTQLPLEAAKMVGVPPLVLRVNLLEAVDFNGVPWPVDDPDGSKLVRWLMPEFMPRMGTKGIIFLDELPQAPIPVQCAAMRVVDHLPPTWQCVAAGNRVVDRAGAGQVATHVLSRFTHIDVEVSNDDWQRWAFDNNVRADVRGYLQFRPGNLFKWDAAAVQNTRVCPSPRSWHRVSRLLDTASPDITMQLVAGTVGDGIAVEFEGFCRTYQSLPDIDWLIDHPKKADVPEKLDVMYATCAAIADRAKTIAKEKFHNIAEYLVRLKAEYATMLIIDIVAAARKRFTDCRFVLDDPLIAGWIQEHLEILSAVQIGK